MQSQTTERQVFTTAQEIQSQGLLQQVFSENNNSIQQSRQSKYKSLQQVLSLTVCILVVLIVVGNLQLTKYLIKKSSEEAVQQQIKENLYNSATEYSAAILEIFTGYSSTLEILNRISLSAMKRDDTLFDFEYIQEFPIIGPGPLSDGHYYSMKLHDGEIPRELERTYKTKQEDYPNYKFTYSSWQYASLGQEDYVSVTQEGQEILEACDVLNYVLEDFFFDKNVTHINSMYFSYGESVDNLFLFFPGGIVSSAILEYGDYKYEPRDRPWYSNTKQIYQKYPDLTQEMVITGPYMDFSQNTAMITISRAIVDNNGIMLGVSSIDILGQQLQNIIDNVQFYQSGFLAIVSKESEHVLNNPYHLNAVYKINDTKITGIDQDLWGQIKNKGIPEDQILEGRDHRSSQEIIVIRTFMKTKIPDQDYILIVIVPKIEAYRFLRELEEMMDETFKNIQIITVITISVTCLIAVVSGSIYSNRIVTPLLKLTEYAKFINSNATKKSFTQNIKIDLDSIKASDKIGELIYAFKNLVKGLSGIKKGARTEILAGNEKIQFPKNYYQNQKMPWRDLIDKLPDYNHSEYLEDIDLQKLDSEIRKQQDIHYNNSSNQNNSKTFTQRAVHEKSYSNLDEDDFFKKTK